MGHDLISTILEMSITGGTVIAGVVILNILLRKGPRILSYCLWAVVLFRLLCPVSFESPVAVVPREPVGQPVLTETVVPPISTASENVVTTPTVPPEPTPVPWQTWALAIWLTGVAIMAIYGIVSYWRLQKKLGASLKLRGNTYISDQISTPFVMGLFRPKIYLPADIAREERQYVLAHERHHIARLDHITRFWAFVALAIHWFNPMVWVAFYESAKDMEASCDEAVLKKMPRETRGNYAQSLLRFTTGNASVMALGFGEHDTKDRIKRVLSYKKPGFWVVLLGTLVAIVVGVILLANPVATDSFPITNNVADFGSYTMMKPLSQITEMSVGDLDVTPEITLTLNSDFTLKEDGEIPFFYTENGETKSRKLELDFDQETATISAPKSIEPATQEVYSLAAYLEAVQYMPVDAVVALSQNGAERYLVSLVSPDTKTNPERCVSYNKNGVKDSDGYHIRLDVQPIRQDMGVGSEIIHLFYNIAETGQIRLPYGYYSLVTEDIADVPVLHLDSDGQFSFYLEEVQVGNYDVEGKILTLHGDDGTFTFSIEGTDLFLEGDSAGLKAGDMFSLQPDKPTVGGDPEETIPQWIDQYTETKEESVKNNLFSRKAETLQYIFGEFLEGNQSGPRADTMWGLACALSLDVGGLESVFVSTQYSFDEWKEYVLGLWVRDQDEYLQENMPGGWILLQCMDERGLLPEKELPTEGPSLGLES